MKNEIRKFFSDKMKAYWASKTPEERRQRMKAIKPTNPWANKTKEERIAHAIFMNHCKYGKIKHVKRSS